MKELSEIRDWLKAHPMVQNISVKLYDDGLRIQICTKNKERVRQWISPHEIDKIDASAYEVLHSIYTYLIDDEGRKRIRFDYFGE